MMQFLQENFSLIITPVATYFIGYHRNKAEVMKTIISGCTERLALIERVEAMQKRYERISFKMKLIEGKLLECIVSNDESRMNPYRERLLDLMSFCLIPAFKYYAEAFFTVYSSSSADMDYFFNSRIVGFLDLIISSINIANNELIFPDRSATTGIDPRDVDELFRIAGRHVGLLDFRKRWQLRKLRKSFKPLIKIFPPILSDKTPIATKREALLAALISKLESMNEESLESVRDFVCNTNTTNQLKA